MFVLELPEEPVDGHTIIYWGWSYNDHLQVTRYRLVYHVNATWEEVYPDDQDVRGPGGPFVDQWHLLEGTDESNERGVGRIDGWWAPTEPSWVKAAGLHDRWATQLEALRDAAVALKDHLRRFQNKVACAKQCLDANAATILRLEHEAGT